MKLMQKKLLASLKNLTDPKLYIYIVLVHSNVLCICICIGIHGEPGIKRSKVSLFNVLIISTIKAIYGPLRLLVLIFLQVASADEVVKTIISHMTDSSNQSHLSLKSGKSCNWSAQG